MVGERKRREFAETIKDMASKAGMVGIAAFAAAGSILIMALAVLVLAFRSRRPA